MKLSSSTSRRATILACLSCLTLAACGEPFDEAELESAPLIAGKYLVGGVDTYPTYPVSLSNGTIDWMSWSQFPNRKANVTPQIAYTSKPTGLGAGGRSSFSWTGGTPTATGTGVSSAIVQWGVGQGFTFTVPAETQARRLVVYGMVQGGVARLKATMDGLTDSRTVTAGSWGGEFAYTVDFDTSAAGKVLTFSLVGESVGQSEFNQVYVWLHAAQVFKIGSTPNVSLSASDPREGRAVPLSYAGDSVKLTAGAEGDVRGVEFFRNGTKLGQDTTYPYELTVTLPVGRSNYTVKATSLTGKESTVSNTVSLNAWFVASNSTTQAIPDNNAAGVQGPLSVTTVGGKSVKEAIALIDVRHTWDSDLMFQVRSPTGKVVTLASGVGGSGDDFSQTIFIDNSATPIAAGFAPFAGGYAPAQPLSGLVGQPLAGTWRLDAFDLASQDVGTIDQRKLFLRVDD